MLAVAAGGGHDADVRRPQLGVGVAQRQFELRVACHRLAADELGVGQLRGGAAVAVLQANPDVALVVLASQTLVSKLLREVFVPAAQRGGTGCVGRAEGGGNAFFGLERVQFPGKNSACRQNIFE